MKKNKKYKHSFARKLTLWVMLVLLIMMGTLAYFIYYLVKEIVVDYTATTVHISMQLYGKSITDVMSNVSVAVKNNVFDVERDINQPGQLQNIVERMVTHNPNIRSCSIRFTNPQKGKPFAWRKDSTHVEKTPLKDNGNAYLESEWFRDAIAADSAYWSEPFFDSHDGKTPLVSYMQPIHDQQGKAVGIFSADLSLDFMTEFLKEQYSMFAEDMGHVRFTNEEVINCYVLAKDGTYITHSDQRRILKGNLFNHIKDADEPGAAQEIIEKMKNGEKSNFENDELIRLNRVKTYMFYAPLEGTDWILAIAVPEFALTFLGILFGLIMSLIIAFVLLVTFFVCRIAIQRASSPLKQLAATADEVAGGQFDTALPEIKSRDEIHMLRDSFENMQHSLTDYINELKSTTAAKASIESELKIAHDIQMSMVPKTYPAFPDRDDIDIYGFVRPAKAVGGDLYDFYINDEKLFFCIGDVSGKGVPASLVMAVARSLFRNISAYTQNPSHIVMSLNEALSSNNDTGMFVTIFLGVLDLATGHLSYTNAGHNNPLIMINNEVSELACDSNIPIGVMSGWQFSSQDLQFNTGDSIFLFTDGLNEAEDINLSQFGMDRVQQIMKSTINQPQTLIETMNSSVKMFVGDAEQSDDLTMLAIKFTKP